MKKKILITTTIGLFIGLIGFGTYTASAADDANSGQALEIAPPVVNLSANPGQTVTTQISLRDVSKTKLVVTGEVNDFVAAGEDGTPKILMDTEATEENPYSLKSWVAPLTSLTLNPRQIENLPVTINVPANAAPGGYYAVIRFTAVPPELEGTGVSLSASLGSLVLLKVNGKVNEKMSIEEFSVTDTNDKKQAIFESMPLQFIERLKNEGTVHEQPAGQITIKDMFGKTVAAVNMNLPPRNVLPNSIRKFEQPLDKSVLGNRVLFGLYSAELKVTYGADKQTMIEKVSFWVIPYRLIGFGILGLVIAFFVLRHMIRRYNRAIIRKAQGGGSSKRRK